MGAFQRGKKKQADEGKVQATFWARLHHSNSDHSCPLSRLRSHPSLSIFLSGINFLLILRISLTVLIFPQNDDGPDVRAGSGDILLVHATETDRKGTVQTTLRLVLTLCVCVSLGFRVTGAALFCSFDRPAFIVYSKTDLFFICKV